MGERNKVIAVQGEASPSRSPVHVDFPRDSVGKAPRDLLGDGRCQKFKPHFSLLLLMWKSTWLST